MPKYKVTVVFSCDTLADAQYLRSFIEQRHPTDAEVQVTSWDDRGLMQVIPRHTPVSAAAQTMAAGLRARGGKAWSAAEIAQLKAADTMRWPARPLPPTLRDLYPVCAPHLNVIESLASSHEARHDAAEWLYEHGFDTMVATPPEIGRLILRILEGEG
jgi:hypothetical protein